MSGLRRWLRLPGRHRLHSARHRATGNRSIAAHRMLHVVTDPGTGTIPAIAPPRRRHSTDSRLTAAITPAAWWDGGRA